MTVQTAALPIDRGNNQSAGNTQPSSVISAWQDYGVGLTFTPVTINDPTEFYDQADVAAQAGNARLIGPLDGTTILEVRGKYPKAGSATMTTPAKYELFGVDHRGKFSRLRNANDTTDAELDAAATDAFDADDNAYTQVTKDHRWDTRGHRYALIMPTVAAVNANFDASETFEYKAI